MAPPVLLFDGDCGFCRRWVERWRRRVGEAAELRPFPDGEADRSSVRLVMPDGGELRGAEAVFRLLALASGGGGLWWCYRRIPLFAPVSEAIYGWVARHRVLASRLTRALAGSEVELPSFHLARRVFLAMLGAAYLAAFLSFAVQARGLIGERGITPFPRLLEWADQALPRPRWSLPSGLWWWRSDAALLVTCALGGVAGAVGAAGLWPRAALAAAYALYLSLVSAGGIFFGYQWDVLLLEIGFLAIFLAPGGLRPFRAATATAPPVSVGLWLGRWLLFRLMFMSGVVKLASGDPAWRALDGLQYHYWSQPLPTWTSYLADLLPAWAQRASCALMFFIELVVPFFLFAPRRLRHAAVALTALLQLAIALTGNYGFFNWLTLALCALCVDDQVWRRVAGIRRWGRPGEGVPVWPRSLPARAGWLALAAVLVLLGSVEVVSRLRPRTEWPAPVETLEALVAPFHLVSAYGLFAVMTTDRQEIDLQGSADGQRWTSYRFRYKPGPLDRRPRFAPLHMPRLDWQMWFAALGRCEENGWLLALQQRLLEGSPPVQALFEEDPFPDAPPRYLRTTIAPYRFAPFTELRAQGAWWRRGGGAPYCPVLTLEGGSRSPHPP